MTINIYNGENLLFHAEGFNEALISNIVLFPSTKDDKKDYFIEAKFNIQGWP